MTLYERLVQDVKHGKYPVVVDKDGDYRIFYHIREGETLNSFGYSDTIEKAWRGGDSFPWSKQKIIKYVDQFDWKFHSYFYPPIEPYKVGQKVRVSKEILKFEDLVSVIREWAENETVLEIYEQENWTVALHIYSVTESNKIDVWSVEHTHLEPVYDDEPTMTKEEFLALGKKYGWIKKGEVIE